MQGKQKMVHKSSKQLSNSVYKKQFLIQATILDKTVETLSSQWGKNHHSLKKPLHFQDSLPQISVVSVLGNISLQRHTHKSTLNGGGEGLNEFVWCLKQSIK